jgi:ankyrin repeat protein
MDYQREVAEFQRACSRGDAIAVIATLATERGRCMANTIPERDGTILGAAVHSGSMRIVTALVDAGVNVNLCDAKWGSALHHACLDASYIDAPGLDAPTRLEMAAYLLDHGAHVDIRREDWETPISLAAQCGFPEMVALLLSRGANIETRDPVGCGLLISCIKHTEFTGLQRGLACIEALCRAGADVNGDVRRPLLYACGRRSKVGVPLAMALLCAGACVDADIVARTEMHASDRFVLKEALAQIGDVAAAHAAWLAAAPGRRTKAAR